MTRRGFLIAVLVTTLIYCGKTFWNYTDDIKTYKKFKEVTLVEEQFKKDSIARHQKDSAAGMVKDSLTKRDSAAAKKDTLTKEQKNNKSAWEGMLKGMKYDSTKDKEENKAMRSGYGKIWDHLLQKSQGKEAAWLYRTGIWDISSMMFLGMALLGFGFFNHRFSRSNYLIIALVGILTGVLLAWLRLGLYQEKLADYAKYITTHIVSPNQFFPLERLLMATGYAALLMFLLKTDFLQWLWQAFAAVGRMALSNYFLQTIACTLFFYGYGFGYFGRLSPAQLYFFVAETWLLQTAFSVIWLRYHHYGPAEWLWRWMTYGFKKFPNQKDKN
jgi:uncharacterized protein